MIAIATSLGCVRIFAAWPIPAQHADTKALMPEVAGFCYREGGSAATR